MRVAPSAGAWIETAVTGLHGAVRRVAPSAGAWIETAVISQTTGWPLVAPSAGAWIETSTSSALNNPESARQPAVERAPVEWPEV